MPFTKGTPANPSGYNGKREYLNIATRRAQFRKSMFTLMQIRDGRIEELGYTRDGTRIAVAAKISDIIASCVKLMEYTAGKPDQHVSVDVLNGGDMKPNALIIDLSRRTLTLDAIVQAMPPDNPNDKPRLIQPNDDDKSGQE